MTQSPAGTDVPEGELADGELVRVVYVTEPVERPFVARVEHSSAETTSIDLFRLPGRQTPPGRGEPIVIVADHRTPRRAFEAHVLAVRPTPPRMEVTRPVEAQRDERRSAPRVPYVLEFEGTVPGVTGVASTFRGKTQDLSRRGAALSADIDLPPDTEVALHVLLGDESPPLAVQAVTLPRIARGRARGALRVRFTSGDGDAFARLETMLEQASGS
ncbi:MAG: PilZ domain-containing protein [Dehalococcoidia bacterium]